MKGLQMNASRFSKGFTMVELTIAIGVFSLMTFGIMLTLSSLHSILTFESKMSTVESHASMFIDHMGRDFREASYVYVYAGDFCATTDANGTDINVARNYFSSTPQLGGTTLVPGISNEGWGQCPNPLCSWSNQSTITGMEPMPPMAFLAQPIRNNAQPEQPTHPPPSLQFSALDAVGRLYSNLESGDACPNCGSVLEEEAFFSGACLFSPRKADNTFSCLEAGDGVQWESMIFYCPYRRTKGVSEMRRYVFHASSVNINASLMDLLDFDGNGIIESPPMTNPDGDFVLDAEGECFYLISAEAGNNLLYMKWDNSAGRRFRIEVDRDTGIATVTVQGGLYGAVGTVTIPLEMYTYATGLSDFEVSNFINNPSWDGGASIVNPLGVMELGAVRVTFQVDRSTRAETGTNQTEAVQSIMFRPMN